MRVIKGQSTLLARAIHKIAVDSVHDEIVAPNPFAEAILFFRGGADGEEAPLRVIQGPKTKLISPDNVAVDPQHNEVFAAQEMTNAVLVFKRDASGDAEPVRVIHGPKTRLNRAWQIAVDPLNNLLAVANKDEPKGILIFNRTDDGDVAPRAIISMEKGPRDLVLYPEGKKIFASLRETKEGRKDGFIGVWKYGDHGDVPPWAIMKGSATTRLEKPGGLVLNPEAKELIVEGPDFPTTLLVYHLPEVF